MKFSEIRKKRKYFFLLFVSILLLAVSFAAWVYFALQIQNVPAVTPSYDFLLSILPKIQHTAVGWFYVIGFALTVLIAIAFFIVKDPAKLPYIILIWATFTLLRDFLFSVTVLDAPVGRAEKIGFLEYDRDLFPSGHAGIPFITGLVTDNRWFRYFLFAISGVMAVIVLVTRIHYSIDVFGGYFICYGIYALFDKYVKKWFDFSKTKPTQVF